MQRKRERLEITMPDGQRLRGECNTPGDGDPVRSVILAHGFASNRSGEKALALEQECERRRWGFAAFDFRAHGESDGTMLELRGTRLLEELEQITALIARRKQGPLCLVGSSMGGWAAAWHAVRSTGSIAACALIAPAFHFLEWRGLSEADLVEWRRTGRYILRDEFTQAEISSELLAERDLFRPEGLIAACRTPLLIFHGMQDDVVPYMDSVEFAAACAEPQLRLMLFKNGDHRLNLFKQTVARMCCDFFEEVGG